MAVEGSAELSWMACVPMLLFFHLAVVVQSLSCPTLCGPMDCSTPGTPVLHYLPEFAQIPVH